MPIIGFSSFELNERHELSAFGVKKLEEARHNLKANSTKMNNNNNKNKMNK